MVLGGSEAMVRVFLGSLEWIVRRYLQYLGTRVGKHFGFVRRKTRNRLEIGGRKVRNLGGTINKYVCKWKDSTVGVYCQDILKSMCK